MKNTVNESGIEGRIVNVGSALHAYGYKEGIRFDKINDEERCALMPIFLQTLVIELYVVKWECLEVHVSTHVSMRTPSCFGIVS